MNSKVRCTNVFFLFFGRGKRGGERGVCFMTMNERTNDFGWMELDSTTFLCFAGGGFETNEPSVSLETQFCDTLLFSLLFCHVCFARFLCLGFFFTYVFEFFGFAFMRFD